MATSCSEDFLDTTPQGFLTNVQFPTSAEDAEQAVNAIYGGMRNWNYTYGGYPLPDIMSDDAVKGSNPGDAARLTLVDNFEFTPTQPDIATYYAALYRTIRHANVVIDRVPEITMDADLKSRYIAEAKFLRAFSYFNFVRTYGGGPLVTTPNPDPALGRSPANEIYEQVIIPDLNDAIEALPLKSEYSNNERGRATQGAAKALLARVYLYRENWSEAERLAEEVINSVEYDLEPNYSDVFTTESQFGIESVFELGGLPNASFDLGGIQFNNTQGLRGDPNLGWGFNRPSLDLINSYDPSDPRLDATVVFLGEVLDTILVQGDEATPDSTFEDGELVQIETYNQKTFNVGDLEFQYGNNLRFIRFAEVLLIAAEAANKNNSPGDALMYLNRVRSRVGLPDITTTDQEQLNDLIMEERRHELALEQHRYYDLVRTGRASEVLGPLGYVEGKHNLWPIPQTEIDLSGGILTQNPEY